MALDGTNMMHSDPRSNTLTVQLIVLSANMVSSHLAMGSALKPAIVKQEDALNQLSTSKDSSPKPRAQRYAHVCAVH